MAKQLAERKKRRLDEKKQEDVKKEEQELKLKVIFLSMFEYHSS